MKRLLKWLFGITLFLIIIVISAVFALPYLVDPNEYKDDIIALLKPQMKGRDLQIPGDIKFSVYPWLGVEVGEMVIGNAEGFILKPFMTIESSKAHVRLLSLLSEQIEVKSLEFDNIKINLQQDAEGKNNWSDLAKKEIAYQPRQSRSNFIKVANQPATDKDETKGMIPNLKISTLLFHNAQIQLDDKKARDVITLSKLNLDAGPINNFNPIPVKGKFNFHSKRQQLVAAAAFASSLTLTKTLDTFTFNHFILNTNVSGKAIGKKPLKSSLKIPVLSIQTTSEHIGAKAFSLKVDDMNGDGHFSLKQFGTPIIRLGFDMKKLDINKFIAQDNSTAQSTAQQTANSKATDESIPTVEDILEGKDKQVALDESARIFAPLTAFGGSDLQGTIKVAQLKVQGLNIKDVKVTLLARSGRVSALSSAKLYDGHYEGDLQIDTKRKPVRVTSRQKLKNIQMGPFVVALTGKETLTGRANYQSQLYSSGDTHNALTENLRGDAQFSVKNAKVKTLDLKRLILKENYEKLDFAKETEEDKNITAFDSMRGTLRIKEGIVYNKDFRATSRRIHLKGAGYTSLVEKTLKYTMITIPKKSFGMDIAGQRYDLKDKNIPTHFSGPWSNIKINNDLAGVIKGEFKQTKLYKEKRAAEEEAKSFVKEETDKLKEKFKNKLKLPKF